MNEGGRKIGYGEKKHKGKREGALKEGKKKKERKERGEKKDHLTDLLSISRPNLPP